MHLVATGIAINGPGYTFERDELDIEDRYIAVSDASGRMVGSCPSLRPF
ncbi:MAG: hypothetical protein AB7S61_00920 [Methanoregulaceae archaeon]